MANFYKKHLELAKILIYNIHEIEGVREKTI